jgi:hypothetical protein
MNQRFSLGRLAFGALVIGSLTIGGSGLALAQGTEEAAAGPSHPAHIHAGDCANLDPNPAAPLNNVEPRLNESDDDNANEPVGVLTASPVLYSDSEDLDLKWDDMLAESHSINVHESDENIQNYIACGEIGGVVVDDELVIALHPMNDSGYTGIAKLTKDGDGNVDVEVFLAEPVNGDNQPDATPAA